MDFFSAFIKRMDARKANKARAVETMTIYFRGGSTMVIDGITNWSNQRENGKLSTLNLTQLATAKNRVMIEAFDISEVIGITTAPGRR